MIDLSISYTGMNNKWTKFLFLRKEERETIKKKEKKKKT
jgi:hypothetical protein